MLSPIHSYSGLWKNDLALAQFPYYNEPLSPSSGMQSQLPILLAEYTFRSRRDVTDYLALLDQVDDYFASLLLYEQEKSCRRLPHAGCFLEKVRKQCDTIVTIQELAQGTHFLQTTFEDRLVELQAQGILSAEVVSSFLKENDRSAHHGSTACLRHTIRRTVLSGDFRLCRSDIFYLSGVSRRDHRYIRRPAERSRPVAGWEDLLSPPAFRRDRFLPFRRKNWCKCFWRNFRRNRRPSAA